MMSVKQLSEKFLEQVYGEKWVETMHPKQFSQVNTAFYAGFCEAIVNLLEIGKSIAEDEMSDDQINEKLKAFAEEVQSFSSEKTYAEFLLRKLTVEKLKQNMDEYEKVLTPSPTRSGDAPLPG